MDRTKLLIIDEDIAYRDIFHKLLQEVNDIDVVGAAPTAKLGLDKIPLLKPDVILASASLEDIPIKKLTKQILDRAPDTGIIVTVHPYNSLGALNAIEALDAGAFDFSQKIIGKENEEKKEILKRKLVSKIRCFSIEHFSKKAKILSADSVGQSYIRKGGEEEKKAFLPRSPEEISLHKVHDCDAVIIGVSTGGPKALNEIIPSFPASFPVPIIIVLHMPKSFTRAMASELNRKAHLTVVETQDGMECTPGNIYLAQGGIHLAVERGTRNRVFLKAVDSPPENGCKPSVDVLFRSAAAVFKGRVLPVILTGMGSDGTKGLAEIKKNAVYAIAQDKASSVVWGMPGSAVNAGYIDEVLPLYKIAQRVIDLV